jgi:hypothetical protein
MKLRLIKLRNFFLILAISLAGRLAIAQNSDPPAIGENQIEIKSAKIFIGPEISALAVNGTSFVSAGIDSTFFYALSTDWGMGVSLRQGFATNTFAALFTEIDVQGKWALTGSLRLKKQTVRLGGVPVAVSEDKNEGGLRAQFFVHQYFFNVGNSVYPVPGIGAGVAYEFSSTNDTNYTVGLRLDRASNGAGLTFYPVQVFFGLGFWL